MTHPIRERLERLANHPDIQARIDGLRSIAVDDATLRVRGTPWGAEVTLKSEGGLLSQLRRAFTGQMFRDDVIVIPWSDERMVEKALMEVHTVEQ